RGRRRGRGRLRARTGRSREVRRRLAGRLRRRLARLRGADSVAHALERHVALVGFMGAGKSTLGAQVAGRLGRRFVDLDRELERSLRKSIPQVFTERGEAEFRVLEAEAALATLRNERPAVVALGGGDRPLAQEEASFRALHERRSPLYAEAADAVARDVDGIVLAAAGIEAEQ